MGTELIKVEKFVGVYYNLLKTGAKSYVIKYKHPIEKKAISLTLGSNGINAGYANQVRIETIAKIRLGENSNIPILKAKQNKTNMNDLANNYLKNLFDTRGITKSTKQAKSRYINRIAPFIGTMQLSQLTKKEATKIQKSLLDEGLSNTTINHITTLISTMINHNIKNDLIKGFNPLIGFKKLKANSERAKFLNKEDVKQLLDHTKDNEVLHLFTLLSLSTGARLKGVLSIQKKDIDLESNTIKLHDFKSGGTYQGFLKDDIKELLEKTIKPLRNNDYVISYDKGKQLEEKRIQRPLKKILDNLFNQDTDPKDTLNRVVVHTLRHTFASLLAINGTPIFTIQNLMNHKDIKMTLRYAKLAPDTGLKEVNNLF